MGNRNEHKNMTGKGKEILNGKRNRKRSFSYALSFLLLLVTLLGFRGTSLPAQASSGTPLQVQTDSGSALSSRKAQVVMTGKKKKNTDKQSSSGTKKDASDHSDHYTFRSKKLLNQHYDKHGFDMGFDSAAEYEEAACTVVHNPDALHKTEKEDGDDIYYVEDTNEFVVVSTDGYIRTYFWPDAGIKYYNRQ